MDLKIMGILVRKPFPGGKKSQRKKMKEKHSGKSTEAVPVRIRAAAAAAAAALMAVSGAAGAVSLPENTEIPVVTAEGDVITPPWYITVEGKRVALVESEEAARQTLRRIVDRYSDSENTVLDIEIREETGTEKMDIKTGDPAPKILTAAEAERKLIRGDGEDSYLTVVTTEEAVEEEIIAYKEEYRVEPSMYAGETKVQTEGKEGIKEVTKKVIRENGREVKEEILEEEIKEEAVDRVILAGTREYDGYGGGAGGDEEGVSYDPEATYGQLALPVRGFRISSEFGPRWGGQHRGIDMALAQGSPIYAAEGGKVYFSGWGGSYGNIVKIDHGNGMQTYYAHCSQLLVSRGQEVSRGEKIALVGSTGNSTGPHLHFEVIINGSLVDPSDFLEL